MVETTTYTIKALDETTWDAFAALVERNNGVFGGCWCIGFHPEGGDKKTTPALNRRRKHERVQEGKAHAALVFDGDSCVAGASALVSSSSVAPRAVPHRGDPRAASLFLKPWIESAGVFPVAHPTVARLHDRPSFAVKFKCEVIRGGCSAGRAFPSGGGKRCPRAVSSFSLEQDGRL